MSRQPDSPPEQVSPERAQGLTGSSAVVASWTLVSRLTGLLRVVCVGAVLGPTFFANAYQSTNALPNLVYELLTGGLFTALLVPPLVAALDRQDGAAAKRLASGFLGAVLLAFTAAAVVLVAAGPAVLGLLGLGVTDPDVAREQQRVGMLLLALVMPQLLFYGVAGTAAAAMNARGRFALAAAAPALENLGIVATLLVFARVAGGDVDIAQVTTAQVVLLGAGTTAAVGLHAIASWLGARAAGVTLVPTAGWRDKDVRPILRSGVPTLALSGMGAARTLGVLVVAGSIPGGVVAFLLARNFFNLVTALTARPVATALLPRAARAFRAGDLTRLRDEVDRSFSLVALVALPATCCLLLLAHPLARAVTFGEMATPRGEAIVAAALIGITAGILGDAAFILLTAVTYAAGRPGEATRAMLLRVLITAAGMGATLVAAEGSAVLLGLGLSLAVGDLISSGYLARRVLRALPPGGGTTRSSATKGLLSGLVMAPVGLGVAVGLRRTGLDDVLTAVAAAAACALCFLAFHLLLRTPELAGLLRLLRRAR